MTVTTDFDRAAVDAASRVTVYSLLATGLMYPIPERMGVIRDILLPGIGMLDLGPDMDERVEKLAVSLPPGLDDFRHQYMELFPPIASQDAPGYETGYRGEGIFQQSAIMADIAGFYRAHGLRAGGSERERPDHITVELEFLAVVAKKEAMALAARATDNAEVCRDTAASFLADHLGCWGRAFGLRASAVSSSSWYATLGELLTLWIEAELETLEVRPVEIADSPLPQEPPDDGSCGPCPTPGGGASP